MDYKLLDEPVVAGYSVKSSKDNKEFLRHVKKLKNGEIKSIKDMVDYIGLVEYKRTFFWENYERIYNDKEELTILVICAIIESWIEFY